MRKISDFSVNHPVTVTMIVLGVILLGWISFQRLGIDLFPDLNNPRLFIEIEAGERPPEEMEKQYVDRIENLIFTQKGVSEVSSVIRVGAARITVEYGWDMDMDEAFLNLQKAAADFGQGDDDLEITITQHDPNSDPIMTVALVNPEVTDMDGPRRIAENYIRNELVRIEGIAGVEISGSETKEVIVQTDSYMLEAYGLTVDDIASKIRNYNVEASGGTITEMGISYLIKGVSEMETIEDIRQIILAWKEPAEGQQLSSGSGQQGDALSGEQSTEKAPVYLHNVADVSLRNRDPENIVRLNGTRALGLSIYKEMRFNTVEASENLAIALDRIEKALPGYNVVVIQDQGRFINSSIGEVRQTAMFGIFLAILILFVFLRRLGTTAIISISIPVSIVATFNLMYFKGLSLNIMTLGGLALGAGMLVDNAIVVVENIVRNIESGMGVKEAAASGTAQVGGAITASTITTIVVFLPIVYLHGAAGELFKDQAWTVAFALISSLAVAVLIIPMLAGRFLRSGGGGSAARPVRFERYGSLLSKALGIRWAVIAGAAALVVVAVLLLPLVGSEFIPDADADEYSIHLTLPEGSDLTRTDGTVIGLEELIKGAFGEDIETLFSTSGAVTGIGSDETSVFQDENTAVVKIRFAAGHGRSTGEIMAGLGTIVSSIPGVESRLVQDQTALRSILGAESSPIVIEIKGDDLETLTLLADQARERLSDIGDLYNVETSLEHGRPEINVVVDRLRAGMLQVGLGEVTGTLESRLSGRSAGEWDRGGETTDITVMLPDVGIEDLDRIYIDSGGRQYRIDELASLETGTSPREINRRGQMRAAVVTAHKKEGRPFDHAISEISSSLASLDVPPDYRLTITGEEARRQEEFHDLRFALILSVILVYMVLASQFESLVHPFAILLTIPLAGVGAVLIFFILGRPLSVMAYIGIIMLVGIAVNDSIILIDAINRLRRGGMAKREAIVAAGRIRIRPIIMTSATTILALLPLTLGFGEGASLRAPMALAVIGGLVTSTILTLIVIPCVYSVLDRSR
jgi:HAE1 family hydrophobic/amphiphilic exporter-1